MKKPTFDENELRIIAMYDTRNRKTAIRDLRPVNKYTKGDEEMNALVESCLYKLWRISDEDFTALNLSAYLYDGEAEE